MKKEIKLSKIIKKFNVKELYIPKDIDVENYKFFVSETSQGIYEFLGYDKQKDKILILNKYFLNFYKSLSEDEQKKGIENYLKNKIKIIIFSENFNNKVLLKIFKNLNIPILYSNLKVLELFSVLEPYVVMHNQEPIRSHGSMLSIYGEGVLITGESGIGKSEVVLELIKRNHLFVGDDAIDLVEYANKLIASSPKTVRNFLEVRGLGFINIKKTYGSARIKNSYNLDLIIELIDLHKIKNDIDRLGTKFNYKKIKNIEVPIIQVPISGGRSVSDIIESAVVVYKQRKYENYVAIEELNENIIKSK